MKGFERQAANVVLARLDSSRTVVRFPWDWRRRTSTFRLISSEWWRYWLIHEENWRWSSLKTKTERWSFADRCRTRSSRELAGGGGGIEIRQTSLWLATKGSREEGTGSSEMLAEEMAETVTERVTKLSANTVDGGWLDATVSRGRRRKEKRKRGSEQRFLYCTKTRRSLQGNQITPLSAVQICPAGEFPSVVFGWYAVLTVSCSAVPSGYLVTYLYWSASFDRSC